MDPDISIWRKTGHFYFALTRTQKIVFISPLQSEMCPALDFLHRRSFLALSTRSQ
jgi:hypothetical protein